MKPIEVTIGEVPTVEEALERLAGRRCDRIELEARAVYVKQTQGQCRKTRRNNLRIARANARAEKAKTVTLNDHGAVSRFEAVSPEDVEAVTGIPVEGQRGDGQPRGTVTVVSIDRSQEKPR